jgi:hypothetical protein
MAVNPKLAALMLVAALAGCGSPGSSPDVRGSSVSSARAVLGAAPSPSELVTVVKEANFQSPSKNITCDLTSGAVRCEIVKRDWQPPPRPASCELGWGHGTSITNGEADLSCAGDTIIGTATEILPYGSSLRAGSIQCDSGNAAMRCVDQKTLHGFTLAVADYKLF